MALTDTAVRQAKADFRDRKISDGKGLYLLVTKGGSKLWRLKYRTDGKEKKLALGSYPEVSLKEAREKRDIARKQLASGCDPSVLRREEKIAKQTAGENTFGSIALEFIAKLESEGKSKATTNKQRWLVAKLSAGLRRRPVSEITPHELLHDLQRIENLGQRETVRRLRSFCGRVFRYAVATARANSDPAQPLQGAFAAPVVTHRAAITDPVEVGKLLEAIDRYSGQPITRLAMLFSAHVYQRPGEIRQAEWDEFDLETALWIIPESRMKQRLPHRVPLSPKAVSFLREAETLSGGTRFVFPKLGSKMKPMSENAIVQALRRMGYGPEKMTAHGFRSTASTLLNESGLWSIDAIERSLAHSDPNQVRAAYHRGTHWDERVKMANWWSDHLEQLREAAKMMPLRS